MTQIEIGKDFKLCRHRLEFLFVSTQIAISMCYQVLADTD